MLRFVANRLVVAVAVAVTVSIISFTLLRLSGDLAASLAGSDATAEQVAHIEHLYGLDKPIVAQYFDWAWRAMHGDLGASLYSNEPVLDLILSRLGITVSLALSGMGIALAVAIPLGVVAAANVNTNVDRAALLVAVFGKAVPSFWFALVLIYVFGVKLRWLPISGTDTWVHYLLPSFTLAVSVMPQLMRLTRGGMIEVLEADFIRTAWAKGLRPRTIFFQHALRNALLPVVAMTAVSFGFLLSGSVIVEAIFSINGIGALAYQAIRRADFPVVQSVLVFVSFAYILLTLLADVINAQLDPRVRLN